MTTIPCAFDPEVLPEWARNDLAVVWLCKRSLEYRCAVCATQNPTLRVILKIQAMKAFQGE